METNIYRASEKDLPEILALQKQAFGEVVKMLGFETAQPLEQTLEEIKDEFRKGIFLKCVTDGNRIIGSVRGHEDGNGSCMVGKLMVDVDLQNRGIGKSLMTELENYFPNCSLFSLFTSTATPNTIHLYKFLGYIQKSKEIKDGIEIVNLIKHKER